mmetsp:Transcript_17111/g.46393  ORF Transcript_17111/g.46393 Transcript_17111/m.46393 type:complete len:296 (+) Transcript_17111:235-1122(+)
MASKSLTLAASRRPRQTPAIVFAMITQSPIDRPASPRPTFRIRPCSTRCALSGTLVVTRLTSRRLAWLLAVFRASMGALAVFTWACANLMAKLFRTDAPAGSASDNATSSLKTWSFKSVTPLPWSPNPLKPLPINSPFRYVKTRGRTKCDSLQTQLARNKTSRRRRPGESLWNMPPPDRLAWSSPAARAPVKFCKTATTPFKTPLAAQTQRCRSGTLTNPQTVKGFIWASSRRYMYDNMKRRETFQSANSATSRLGRRASQRQAEPAKPGDVAVRAQTESWVAKSTMAEHRRATM